MTDYWLSKLFYDLHRSPALAAEYRTSKDTVLERYTLAPEVRAALAADDVAAMSPLVNAYLLRFYFQIRGMPEAEFIARLHAMQRADAEWASEAQGKCADAEWESEAPEKSKEPAHG